MRVTARDGTPALLPAMSVQLELDGGCKCTISASGQSTTAEGANVQGPTGQALKRIQADIAEFKRLYVENLFAEKARINNLYADEAWLTNLFAQDITATGTIRGVTLEGTNGTIGGWNISQYALDQTGTRTVSGVAYDYRYVIQAPSDANGWGSVIAVQRKAEGAENWEYLAQLTYTGALSVQNVNVAGFAVPQIQHGAVSVTVTANTAASFSVTFPKAFSGVPDVVFTPRHNSNVTSLSYKLMSVTSSGFTGYVYSSNAGGHVIHWIAMY